jgi:hypothetical protein
VATDDGLTAAERKALGNVRLVVEIPRALSAQLEGATGAAPNGLENLVRCLVGSVHWTGRAMRALLAEVLAGGFETHLQISREDETARARALADLQDATLAASLLYVTVARLLSKTEGA